jgi:hypothetical protein
VHTHIPHLQTSTSAITCSCLQRVSAVLSHFWAIRAYLEKCSIDKSAVSTDHCACLAGAPYERTRAFEMIDTLFCRQIIHSVGLEKKILNNAEKGAECGSIDSTTSGIERHFWQQRSYYFPSSSFTNSLLMVSLSTRTSARSSSILGAGHPDA